MSDVDQGRLLESQGDLDGAEAAFRLAEQNGDADGALCLGILLRKRGDIAGAHAVYQRAEARGVIEAACNLAMLLEEQGDIAGAEAAYRRADAAGFYGGARGLSQILFARGDTQGSIDALRRADQLGDGEAAYNLGILLRRGGDEEGAEGAFRRSGERGVGPAWFNLGRMLDERGEADGAEDAYRRAVESGDADAAVNLAMLLLKQYRSGAATVFLRRAVELGHPVAAEVLRGMEAESGGGTAFDNQTALAEAAESFLMVLTARRAEVAEAWTAYQSDKARLGREIDLLQDAVIKQTENATRLLGRHPGLGFRMASVTTDREAARLDVMIDRYGTRMVNPDLLQRMGQYLAAASNHLGTAATKFFHGRELNAAAENMTWHSAALKRIEAKIGAMQRELAAVDAKRPGIDRLAAEAKAAVEVAAQRSAEAERALPATLRPWADDAWASGVWREQATGLGSAHLFLGRRRPLRDERLGDFADLGVEYTVPYALTPRENLHVVYHSAERDEVHALARSVLLRVLLSSAPGNTRFTFFDPIGLGQSASSLLELAEYDPALIGGKVWSGSDDLRQRLADHTAHIELVIQKYLRTTYATIDDYNAEAGEVAEPYRYLVVFDFPSGFSEETTRELVRILENGPRCGVRVLLLTNVDIEVPYGIDLKAVGNQTPAIDVRHKGVHSFDEGEIETVLETEHSITQQLAHEIVDHVGRAATSRNEAVVTFDGVFALFRDAALRGITAGLPQQAATVDPVAPQTWWAGSSADAIAAPIGRAGARETAMLSFDSGNHSGALLVGRPGSGKSTLLHSYLAGLTTLYGPEELELYLIDFKEGVEFQVYARESLPHARCVAIESDREFGLSVLQSVEEKLKERSVLFKSTGRSTLSGTGLPRILLVFDEFQVLFARNDKVGLAAAALLETLVRQGRSFGIHLLLGSQSLSGLDALGSHVPQLLPTRILLPATEVDARRVLGEGNDAGQYLTKHGEGILNTAGGAVEANQRFRGAFSDEDERRERVARMRAKADAAGFVRRPVVFEGNAATPIESVLPAQFRAELATSGRAPLRVRVGSPMTINGTADLQLSREPGANVLLVTREGAPSLLTVAAASLAATPARPDIVDFTSIDDGLDVVLGPLLERDRVRVHRRRGFAALLRAVRDEVSDRIAADDVSSPPRVIFLYGLHRARDLDVDGGIDGDPELVDLLQEIVREGPEVGVHTWVWCETVGGLSRRLPSSVLREFSWRLAGRLSQDDSQRLLGSYDAAELRDRQILLTNDDLGLSRRCTSYTVPGAAWLTDLLDVEE
jgi:tetratricopeptide (TPR) repeat protein